MTQERGASTALLGKRMARRIPTRATDISANLHLPSDGLLRSCTRVPTRTEGEVFTRRPPSTASLLRLASYATRDDAGEVVLLVRPMIVINAVDNAPLSSAVVG